MDNMTTFNAEEIEKLEKHDVHTLTEKLIKSTYPQLFLILNQIGYLLQDLKPLLEKSLLLSIHQKMNDELTEIYRKEKQVLFPLLLQLEKEERKVSLYLPDLYHSAI
jgi:hypothetical protein